MADVTLRRQFEMSLADGTRVSFAHGYCGAAAIAEAVRNCHKEPKALFVAEHPSHGGRIFARHVIRWFNFDGHTTLRHCDGNGNPVGAGTHSVVTSSLTRRSTPEEVRFHEDEALAQLALALGMECMQNQAWVFLEYAAEEGQVTP